MLLFSIIALMMMNHFAGIILLITNGSGMLESGNMKPDRMITGSIKLGKSSSQFVAN
jgi:hypothetical protein